MRPFAVLLCLAIVLHGLPSVAGEPIVPAPRFPAPNPHTLPAPGLDSLIAQVAAESRPAGDRIEEQIADLRAEKAEIKTRGPRTAAIVGGVLTGVGVVVGATVALACAAANSGSDTTCKTENATGIGIGAGVVAVAGIVTLVSGLSKLRERNAKRRAIDREILELRRQDRSDAAGLWPARLRADLKLGAEKGVQFSYRF